MGRTVRFRGVPPVTLGPLLLLLVWAVGLPTGLSSSSTAGQPTQDREFLEAKRRFDRVKHHPLEEPIPAANEDDIIEYRKADGTMGRMTQKELRERTQSHGDMPRADKDGKLSKKDEGVATVEELRSKNPDLARIIDAGQYAFKRLQANGYGIGARLKGINTADDGDDTAQVDGEAFRLKLLLTVAEPGDVDMQYEVEIEGRRGSGRLSKAYRIGPGAEKVELDIGPALPEPTKTEFKGLGWWLQVVGACSLAIGVLLMCGNMLASRVERRVERRADKPHKD